jgi:type II secretory pathway pseudopilin PulG
MNNRLKQLQTGRSMIEMLGVLAIVGILSAGGIAGYSMAMQSYKTNLLIERVNLIVTKARTIYKNGNYQGVSNQNLIDSGKLSAKDLENPFGGQLYISSHNTSDCPTSLLIKGENIPKGTCIDILTTDWGGNGTLCSVRSVTSGKATQEPVTVSEAKALYCIKDNVQILWYFR